MDHYALTVEFGEAGVLQVLDARGRGRLFAELLDQGAMVAGETERALVVAELNGCRRVVGEDGEAFAGRVGGSGPRWGQSEAVEDGGARGVDPLAGEAGRGLGVRFEEEHLRALAREPDGGGGPCGSGAGDDDVVCGSGCGHVHLRGAGRRADHALEAVLRAVLLASEWPIPDRFPRSGPHSG